MKELIKKLTTILEQLEQYHGSLIVISPYQKQQPSVALPYGKDTQAFRDVAQLYKQAREIVSELDTKQSDLTVIVKALTIGALTYNNSNDCLECHYCQYSSDNRPYHDEGCPVRLAIAKLEQRKATTTN